jgi:hypothetical protein
MIYLQSHCLVLLQGLERSLGFLVSSLCFGKTQGIYYMFQYVSILIDAIVSRQSKLFKVHIIMSREC